MQLFPFNHIIDENEFLQAIMHDLPGFSDSQHNLTSHLKNQVFHPFDFNYDIDKYIDDIDPNQ